MRRSTSRRNCRACTTSSNSSPTSTSPTEPMEVGPTTHYIMGGIRVDGDTQNVHGAGAVRRRRMCRRACTVPTASAAIHCRICWCSANARATYAAQFAQAHAAVTSGSAARPTWPRTKALEPFSRTSGEGPYQIQHALQGTMQELVGIVRREDEMPRALDEIVRSSRRAPPRSRSRAIASTIPGWHTALDLGNLLTVAEAITRSAIERRESRGGHFRDDFPDKDPGSGDVQHRGAQGTGRPMPEPRADPADADALNSDRRGG